MADKGKTQDKGKAEEKAKPEGQGIIAYARADTDTSALNRAATFSYIMGAWFFIAYASLIVEIMTLVIPNLGNLSLLTEALNAVFWLIVVVAVTTMVFSLLFGYFSYKVGEIHYVSSLTSSGMSLIIGVLVTISLIWIVLTPPLNSLLFVVLGLSAIVLLLAFYIGFINGMQALNNLTNISDFRIAMWLAILGVFVQVSFPIALILFGSGLRKLVRLMAEGKTGGPVAGGKDEFVLKVKNLNKMYVSGLVRTRIVVGAKNVTFDLRKGEIISIAGESGSGKSTVAKMILRLIRPSSGTILFNGRNIMAYPLREYYKMVQAVFQDPYSAFNPFYQIDHVLHKAFGLRGDNLDADKRKKVIWSTLKSIGLNPDEVMGRYPHQLSGGQMQRLLIGRALLIGAQILIADEPTSMIDASTRAGILNLLLTLRKEKGLSVLFITHDIGQAQYLSDRVLVMRKGEVVEQGAVDEVFLKPKHSYTKELLAAVPSLYEKWEEFA